MVVLKPLPSILSQSLSQGSDVSFSPQQQQQQQSSKTKTLFSRRPKNKSHSMQDLLDVTDSPQDQPPQPQQNFSLDAMTLDHHHHQLLLNPAPRHHNNDIMSASITYGSSSSGIGASALTSGFDFGGKDSSSTLKEHGKHFMENVKSQLQRILDPRISSNGNDAFQVGLICNFA